MTPDPIEATLDYLIESARDALTRGEAFVPFGAGARRSGDPLHFDVSAEDAGDAQGAIALLTAGIQQQHGADPLAAAGLCFVAEATIEGGGETAAILAHVETPEGASIDVIQAFVRDRVLGLQLAPPVRREVDPVIFAWTGPAEAG